MEKLLVQYGCGLSCPEGWQNFDTSPTLRLEKLPGVGALLDAAGKRLFPPNVRYGDIVKGLPISENSADAVYASHVLEHLSREDVVRALANTYRILKPRGVFRMVVPDLEWRAREYVAAANAGDPNAADDFITALHLGRATRPKTVLGQLRAIFGNSSHLWMYDIRLMEKLLADAGFVAIRRCKFGDSEERAFEKVEDPGRFAPDYKHDFDKQHEVAFEAIKP